MQAIHVAARLGIADELRDGTRRIGDLSVALDAQPDALDRLMRMLASIGVLSAGEGGTYQLTPLGETLRTDHPNSVRDWALYVGASAPWNAWGHLYGSAQKRARRASSWLTAYRPTTFSNCTLNLRERFNRWMTKQSAQQNSAILDAYDFSKFQVVADIGGGQGSTLAAVLERYPSLRGKTLRQAFRRGRTGSFGRQRRTRALCCCRRGHAGRVAPGC